MTASAGMEDLARALVPIAHDATRTDNLYRTLGEYCHLIRNRLNGLKISFYLLQHDAPENARARWAELEADYLRIEQFVEQVQKICRPMALAPMRAPLGMLVEDRRAAWTARLWESRTHLELVAPQFDVDSTYDSMRLGDALDALVDWRAECGPPDSAVRLAWDCQDGQSALTWRESLQSRPAERPRRANRPMSLALPLLARMLAAHRGTLIITEHEGLRLDLRWPLDALKLPG